MASPAPPAAAALPAGMPAGAGIYLILNTPNATRYNGALIGLHPWPGGAEPILVTWNSVAGGGWPAHTSSVMWWPGMMF